MQEQLVTHPRVNQRVGLVGATSVGEGVIVGISRGGNSCSVMWNDGDVFTYSTGCDGVYSLHYTDHPDNLSMHRSAPQASEKADEPKGTHSTEDNKSITLLRGGKFIKTNQNY